MTKDQLNSITVPELTAMAKELGIEPIPHRKADLVKAIAEAQANSEPGSKLTVAQIAEACFNAAGEGETPPKTWETASEEQQETCATTVAVLLLSPEQTMRQSYEAWYAQGLAAGWKRADVFDEDALTDPDLIPFEELSDERKASFERFEAKLNELRAQVDPQDLDDYVESAADAETAEDAPDSSDDAKAPATTADLEPCPHCTGGVHDKYGSCPYCNGTGIRDEDEPAVPGDDDASRLKDLEDRAFEILGTLTLPELRGVAKELGLPHFALKSVGALGGAIRGHTRAQIAQALSVYEPVGEEKVWNAAESEPGMVDAVDPEGWFTAQVHSDGSATVTILGEPNLHNRLTESVAGDATFSVPNLAAFIRRLQELNKTANSLFTEPS